MAEQRRADGQRLFRARVQYWTGLRPQEWAALPASVRERIRSALSEYYAEVAEVRSPHGGMFDAIAEVYGGLPWVDWHVRGCDDDGH